MGSRDRYELLDVIGHGAGGVVHLARDRQERRYVAAKVLAAPGSDELATHRFLNEQRIAIEHPHLLTPLDWYQTPRSAVLVMELADAGSVDDLVAANPVLSPNFVEQLADHALSGLSALHEAGILHRDIKPGNLMLTREGPGVTLKLGDFGISVAEGSPRLTQDGNLVGTLGYLAPEILEGGEYSVASDLWSLGRTLEVLAERCEPAVSRRLSDLLESMTETDPGLRPMSAAEARKRLDAATDAAPLAVPVVPERVAESVRSDVRSRRRQRVLATLAVTVVLGLAAALVKAAWSDEPAEAEWLVQRRANMASGRVECLVPGRSSVKPRRENLLPYPPMRSFTRGRDWHRSISVALIDDTRGSRYHSASDDDEVVRLGQIDAKRNYDDSYYFDIGERTWVVTPTNDGLGEVVPSDLDAEARRFIEGLDVKDGELGIDDGFDEMGPSVNATPLWAVSTAPPDGVRGYRDSTTRLETLPGVQGSVYGRPAVIGRRTITWRETPDTLVVLTSIGSGSEFAEAIDDRAQFVADRQDLAEQLRPCTKAQYDDLDPYVSPNTAVLLSSDGWTDGLTWWGSEQPPGRSENSGGGSGGGPVGSEGLSFVRSDPEATGVWIWATPLSPNAGSGGVPACARFIPYPDPGDPMRVEPLVRGKECIVEDTPIDAEPDPGLYCSNASVVVDIRPGLADEPQANTLTYRKPSYPATCQDTTGNGITTVAVESGLLAYETVGCPPAAGTHAEGPGTVRWSNGTTSSVAIALEFTDAFKLRIGILGGPFVGMVAETNVNPYPVAGSCDDGGYTKFLFVLPYLNFTFPEPQA